LTASSRYEANGDRARCSGPSFPTDRPRSAERSQPQRPSCPSATRQRPTPHREAHSATPPLARLETAAIHASGRSHRARFHIERGVCAEASPALTPDEARASPGPETTRWTSAEFVEERASRRNWFRRGAALPTCVAARRLSRATGVRSSGERCRRSRAFHGADAVVGASLHTLIRAMAGAGGERTVLRQDRLAIMSLECPRRTNLRPQSRSRPAARPSGRAEGAPGSMRSSRSTHASAPYTSYRSVGGAFAPLCSGGIPWCPLAPEGPVGEVAAAWLASSFARA
jgi:hypothetical protein